MSCRVTDCREEGGACECPQTLQLWETDVYVRIPVLANCHDQAELEAVARMRQILGLKLAPLVAGCSRAVRRPPTRPTPQVNPSAPDAPAANSEPLGGANARGAQEDNGK